MYGDIQYLDIETKLLGHMDSFSSQCRLLYSREIGKQRSWSKTLSSVAFSKHRIRGFSLSPAKIEHDGCINTASWSCNGELLYTGSDDLHVKIWRLGSSCDGVALSNDVRTKHRGNIFCVEPKPDDPDIIVTGSADGTIRATNLHSAHSDTIIHSSDDFIHKVVFDREQPNVLYSAEECGYIHRYDFRSGKKERIFEHRVSCYNICSANDREVAGKFYPSWRSLGAVKSIVQTPVFSYAPHLLVGGQGYVVGLLDMRLISPRSYPNESNEAMQCEYVKLWSPAFPYDNDSAHDPLVSSLYSNIAAAAHTYGRTSSSSNESAIQGAFNALSISGLDVSKDGKRMVANVQGDQVFTFNLQSKAIATGSQAIIGGHVNFATFLKNVSFFGPEDEYVTCGSDSGHMWIWESTPNRQTKLINGQRDSYACRLVNILKADNRTCNGVAVHPYAPLLVSYGIDDDAKVWTYSTLDDHNDHPADNFHALCKHESERAEESFTRISLPLPQFRCRDRKHCEIYDIANILASNERVVNNVPESHGRCTQRVTGPFQYEDVLFNMMTQFQDEYLPGQNEEEKKLLKNDLGPYFPFLTLNMVFDYIAVNLEVSRDYFTATLPGLVSAYDTSASKVLESAVAENLYRLMNLLFMRQHSLNIKLTYRSRWINTNRELAGLFPVMEMYRITERCRLNGNEAFKLKSYHLAHYFYCKAYRYAMYLIECHTIFHKNEEKCDCRDRDNLHHFYSRCRASRPNRARKERSAREQSRRNHSRNSNERILPNDDFMEDTADMRDFFIQMHGREIGEANFRLAMQHRVMPRTIDDDDEEDEDESEDEGEGEKEVWAPEDWKRVDKAVLQSSSPGYQGPPLMSETMLSSVFTFGVLITRRLAPEMLKMCLSNLAATYLAMEKYADCLYICKDAVRVSELLDLTIDAKMLFRKGTAHLQLGDYEQAIKDLTAAQAQAPNDIAIVNKLKQAKKVQEQKKKKAMEAYSKLFSTST